MVWRVSLSGLAETDASAAFERIREAAPRHAEKWLTRLFAAILSLDDADAKGAVHTLATDLGFDAQDAGPFTQARLLEPFALLWISLAFTRGYGREFAFQIIRRS